MSNVINLGRARKRKRREAEKQQADANAIEHGRTKSEEQREQKERGRIGATLDGARLERATPSDVSSDASGVHEPTVSEPQVPEPNE